MDMKNQEVSQALSCRHRKIGGDFQNFALCKSRFSLDIEAVTFS
jgi:hypothetical protein